jgi:hypothetical protein
MLGALALSAQRYPHCPIANCDCHHKDKDEWAKGCYCLCHFEQMNRKFGKDNWNLGDVGASANSGKPRRKPGPRVTKDGAEGQNAKLAGARLRRSSESRTK